MKPAIRLKPGSTTAPLLLVNLEPGHKIFLSNVRDLFWRKRQPPLRLVSRPAHFWPDVFVPTSLPWGKFAQSLLAHLALIGLMLGSAGLWPQSARIVEQPVFHSSDVIYYQPSEYLPPLDTGGSRPRLSKKGDPAQAAQPIISVPPEADNGSQTIVSAPKLNLNRDVPLPNIVEWSRGEPSIPLAATADSKLPTLAVAVVAPPPDLTRSRSSRSATLPETVVAPAPEVTAELSKPGIHLPQPVIVDPPPNVQSAALRRVSDISIGRMQVVAPAPELPLSDQSALRRPGVIGAGSPTAVPPAPAAGAAALSSTRRVVALNLHPASPEGPIDVPAGNRRGTFAATPGGNRGATGAPDIADGSGRESNHGNPTSGNRTDGMPPGLHVGAAATSRITGSQASDNSRWTASLTAPGVTVAPRRAGGEVPADNATAIERRVFGDRKFYAMTLNVPNLNSGGGSWVVHFAELKDSDKRGDLAAPVAVREVDPGYPLELMRRNVAGTVTLSAVIRSDGSVGEVQVLQGVDDRLDQYARTALANWHFQPATKDGNAVAIQAVVMIPFRPMRRF